jgi:hypothetical protein
MIISYLSFLLNLLVLPTAIIFMLTRNKDNIESFKVKWG